MGDMQQLLDVRRRMTFAALARCYIAVARHVDGPGVAIGSFGNLVFGVIGTDIPDLNRIMSPDSERLPSPEAIDAVLERLRAYPAIAWWIPPGPFQADLEERLGRLGLAVNPDDPVAPAMVAELDGLPDPVAIRGVDIEVANSGDAAFDAALVSGAGFGMPAAMATDMAAVFRRLGERPDGPGRYFVARLDGRPVAAAISVLDDDAVGIYNVATVPEARGRGIGGAITLAALLDGRRRGATLGVLEASPMGRPVYERLGFRDVGDTRVLVRRPD
jgi:ribosomal protein S18 acetylase RimI-like enzyme